ncbi:MAG: DUF459 domain-containing protein [Deltaproteobacteria bacterium]|nr:DUF459 domain-containing protein [Deltaproteobacteria bacterium]
MRAPSSCLVLALALALGGGVRAEPAPGRQVPAPVVDARSPTARTPCRADGQPPFVYAIGGSTLQIVLGPMFEKRLGKLGMRVAFQGKSASGLARYDYFDWPTVMQGVLAKQDPDVIYVTLGSNDGQSLRDAAGTWTHLHKPEWRAAYAARIDAFLEQLAGPGRRRAIIWSGPAAHSVDLKRQRGAVVSEVIRERVRRFPGRAWYIDLFSRTATADGGALNELVVGDELVPLRTADGFHLTRPGVEALMYEPVRALLAPCAR